MAELQDAPDPAACPLCHGRLRVLKTRRSAAGVVTRYRACPACPARTVDRSRVTETPIGTPRLTVPGKVVYQNRTHFAESEAATLPASDGPG